MALWASLLLGDQQGIGHVFDAGASDPTLAVGSTSIGRATEYEAQADRWVP